ncbi:MAG: hypothetical protein GX189_00235 [Clostridiales bacterium]|nr:hypothetical protein [Clostridiales bacterium]
MKQKKALLIAAIVLGVAFISAAGILGLGASDAGTQDNPLITLSYLNEQFKPQVLLSFDEKLAAESAAAQQRLDARIAEYIQTVDAKIREADIGSVGFTLVTLSRGQTVTCAVGTELLLRIGTAQAYGPSAPALVDSTAGTTLSAGQALTANHLYMVTIQGNGFKATADTVKILIRGDYLIQ